MRKNRTLNFLLKLRNIRNQRTIEKYKKTVYYHNALVIDDYEKSTGWAWK